MKYYYEGYQILAPLTIASNEPMFDADTVSLRKQRSSQNAQRWELSFSILTQDPADALASIVDFDVAKTMTMPQLNDVNDKLTTVNYPKGAFVTGSNNKVYMVKSDAASVVASNLYPTPPSGLTYSTVANATISYYRSIDNLRGITFSDGVLASPGAIDIIEALG
jgi:hypothetical protein